MLGQRNFNKTRLTSVQAMNSYEDMNYISIGPFKVLEQVLDFLCPRNFPDSSLWTGGLVFQTSNGWRGHSKFAWYSH